MVYNNFILSTIIKTQWADQPTPESTSTAGGFLRDLGVYSDTLTATELVFSLLILGIIFAVLYYLAKNVGLAIYAYLHNLTHKDEKKQDIVNIEKLKREGKCQNC